MPSFRFLLQLALGVLPLTLADTTETFKTCTTKHAGTFKASVGSTTYGLTVTRTATKKITTTPTVVIQPTSTSIIQSTITSLDLHDNNVDHHYAVNCRGANGYGIHSNRGHSCCH